MGPKFEPISVTDTSEEVGTEFGNTAVTTGESKEKNWLETLD